MTHLCIQPNVEIDPPQSQFCRAALRYARAGWHVFPIRPHTRRAYLSKKHHGSRWGSSATPDVVAGMWLRWPQADIGVATGAESGFFAIDIDTIKGHGVDGRIALNALEINCGALPLTRTSVTPTGGEHFLFRHPGRTVKNSTSKLGPGIDVIGDGGMVVVPPSRGRRWSWQVDVAPAPRWLLDLVCDVPQGRARTGPPFARSLVPRGTPTEELLGMMRADAKRGVSSDTEDIAIVDDTELKVWCALQVVPPDIDYLTWFRIGCAIYAGLGEAGFELFDDWSRGAPHKYPKNGCLEKWRECAKTRAIGVRTLYWIALQHDRRWHHAYRVLLSEENAR